MGDKPVTPQLRSPFEDRELAAGYELWYETDGHVADQLERSLLSRLLGGFPDACTALEIGTGTGHFAGWLRAMHWQVVGLDRSAPMLAEAARRDGVALVLGDASALPFAAGRFDVALLITTLEFLPSPACALREAARVARRGIVLGVLNRWNPLAGQRKRSERPLWRAAHFYSPPELANLLRRALGAQADGITWRTTLLPRFWPRRHSRLPIGAFIGMRVRLSGNSPSRPPDTKEP
jgi:ubiquinone/menaquinone biosynthesis C-methylase UbiE